MIGAPPQDVVFALLAAAMSQLPADTEVSIDLDEIEKNNPYKDRSLYLKGEGGRISVRLVNTEAGKAMAEAFAAEVESTIDIKSPGGRFVSQAIRDAQEAAPTTGDA